MRPEIRPELRSGRGACAARAIALTAVVGALVLVSSRYETSRKPVSVALGAAPVVSAPTQTQSPEKDPRRLARVQTEIDARNGPGREQIALFEQSGWEIVEGTEPPDSRVVELDPSALPAREREIQDQIGSNSHEGRALERLREIAIQAGSGKTRWLAIEGLGRSEDPAAHPVLADLYRDLDSPSEKGRVLSMLRPDGLDGRVGALLASEASNSGLSPELRRQAAAPLLAWAATRPTADERARARDEVLSRIPENFRQEVQRMATALDQGGAPY